MYAIILSISISLLKFFIEKEIKYRKFTCVNRHTKDSSSSRNNCRLDRRNKALMFAAT